LTQIQLAVVYRLVIPAKAGIQSVCNNDAVAAD
jgi:hypothetical protein